MPKPGSIASIGDIAQMAYVPTDFEGAIDYWTKTMGVGPFFLFENIALDDMKYRGEPTDARFTVAIAYWGNVQIELVKPENDAPAHYNGEFGIKDRLHHVLILTEDFDSAQKALDDVGAETIVSGLFGGSRVVYADPGSGEGGLVEVLEVNQDTKGLFAVMQDAAKNWDGSDPIRSLS